MADVFGKVRPINRTTQPRPLPGAARRSEQAKPPMLRDSAAHALRKRPRWVDRDT